MGIRYIDDGGDTSTDTATVYNTIDGGTTTDINNPNIDWVGAAGITSGPPDKTIGSDVFYSRGDGSYTGINSETGQPYIVTAQQMATIEGGKGSTSAADMASLRSAGSTSSNWSSGLSSAVNALKGAFKNKDGTFNWGALLPAAAGLYAASQSNTPKAPTGYQGTIPTLTASRQMLTAPPVGRRPGSGGIDYGGNVQFTNPKGEVVSGGGIKSLADLTAAAAANPYSFPQTTNQNAATEEVKSMKAGGLASDGFVIPADVVSHFGNGSTNAGLRLLAERLGAKPIHGPGDGMSDSIPTHIDGKQEARVADGEAFVSPEMVRRIGGGDSERGARKLYAMLDKIREARTGNSEQGKEINPNNFMPGGKVGYASGGIARFESGGATASSIANALNSGVAGSESNLSNWAGPYVTDMLAKGKALAEQPYQAYTGPLTAGASDLQNKVFTGLQNTNFPSNLGQSFTSSGAPTVGADGQPVGGGGIAASYMNPYLQNVLQPQLAELSRQAQINNLSGIGALTKSGAFGGGRQAIMESEANRNLLNAQNTAIGTGYSNAYDKAMQQFNTEQGQAKTLADLMATQGATQRGIESEGIAADKKQFEEARANPYNMLQFQQSLLSGMPVQSQSYTQLPTNNLTQFAQGATSLNTALKALGINVNG